MSSFVEGEAKTSLNPLKLANLDHQINHFCKTMAIIVSRLKNLNLKMRFIFRLETVVDKLHWAGAGWWRLSIKERLCLW